LIHGQAIATTTQALGRKMAFAVPHLGRVKSRPGSLMSKREEEEEEEEEEE
jgi:hypothetical protein